MRNTQGGDKMTENNKLEKNLSPMSVWALALGSIIGWGAFVMPGDSFLPQGGPLGTLIGISLGALMMILLSFCYGYMVEKYPVAGGAFAFAYKGFGRIHAFICGWFLGLTYISIVALNATALGMIGRYMFPGILQQGYLFSVAGWEVYLGEVLLASLAIILFAYTSIKGAEVSGKIQTTLTFSLIASVVIIAIAAIFSSKTSFANLSPMFSTSNSSMGGVLAIVAMAPWAFIGFDSIPQTAEEYNFPPKKALKLMIFAILLGGFVYIVMNTVTAAVFPWPEFISSEPFWATGTAINELLGDIGMLLLAIALIAAILSGIIGFYSSASRLILSMSRATAIPSWFGKIHKKSKTPVNALLFVMIIALIGPWFGRQVLQWIVDMCSVGASVGYLYTSATTFKLSIKENNHLKIKVISFIGVIFSIIFILLLLIPGLPSSLTGPSLIALGVWIVLGLVFYLKNARKYNNISSKELDNRILGESAE